MTSDVAWSAIYHASSKRRAASFFAAALIAALLLCRPAQAANLQWEALPDRERITITMGPSEGMAGKVGRIAPNGILIPFADVPPGLLVDQIPEGAAIFEGTRQLGRALALVTQSPEFGFVVSKQEPTILVIDFFHNPLGARWKATAPATTTEIAPEVGLGPIAQADAATQALASDPQGRSAASAAALAEAAAADAALPATPGVPAEAAVSATAAAQAAPTTTAEAPAGQTGQTADSSPQAATPEPDPDRPKPVVVQLSGTPDHASKVTRMAEAPPVETPPSAMLPPGSVKNATAVNAADVFAPRQPVLDAKTQTAERSAPLPLPEPPLSAAVRPGQSARSGAAVSGSINFEPLENAAAEQGAPTEQTAPQRAAQSPAEAQTTAATQSPAAEQIRAAEQSPAAAPALPPRLPGDRAAQERRTPEAAAPTASAPDSSAQSAPSSPVSDQAPQSAVPAPAPATAPQSARPEPGLGLPLGGARYGGLINTGGMEDIPLGTAPGEGPDSGSLPGAADAPRSLPGAAPGQGAGAGGVHSAPIVSESASPDPGAASSAPPPGRSLPRSPQGQTSPAQGQGQGQGLAPQAQTNATIIYTDAEGNPVEPPPDPLVVMPQILELINQLNFQEALDMTELLLEKAVLDNAQKEEALHIRAEMLFAVHKEDLAAHYKEISDAASQAMSFNPKSRRNAADLLRLGYMNLKLNNIPEAEARFNMLRRQFPEDENVPLTYYYWGDYHFGRNELQKAADEFQYVLQEYPNSQYAREAALGLARSFYRMGYFEQAFNVVDYIERRWERFYVQYPPFLNMMGDVAFRLNKLDFALKHYWLYVNLEPQGDEADIILTRLGDIYAMQREKGAAQELYTESMRRFPDKDGGLVAMMRLAEEGMYDDPTIAGMFAVYDGPFSMRPLEVYRSIIRDHPASALAPLAQVKLALWHLWNKEYEETLNVLSDFVSKYPKHELVQRAGEIAMQTFSVLAAESMQDERYARMREIWEKYPIVHGQGEAMTPESRIALGVSYRQEGKPNEALQAVEPFFLGNKIPEYSEMALSLVLSIYLEHNQWQAVREVARRVELWELKEESARQLDYALALTAENLGEPATAAPIWQKLYDSGKLPPSQMAYAAFFLAREAERERQLEKAFLLGQEALSRLLTQVERNPNPADVGKVQTQLASLMDVAESAGRMGEALRYGEQYLQYLEAGSPERMAVRYRMARIYKKQGDSETWANILREIATDAPGTVYGQLASSELNAASIAEDAAKFSPTGRL